MKTTLSIILLSISFSLSATEKVAFKYGDIVTFKTCDNTCEFYRLNEDECKVQSFDEYNAFHQPFMNGISYTINCKNYNSVIIAKANELIKK